MAERCPATNQGGELRAATPDDDGGNTHGWQRETRQGLHDEVFCPSSSGSSADSPEPLATSPCSRS